MKVSELMIILNTFREEIGDKELILSEQNRIFFDIALYYDNNYDKIVIEGQEDFGTKGL